jgi:hypothetical protein
MKLSDFQIIERHHWLLEAHAGDGPGLVAHVERYLARLDAPGVSWVEISLSAGVLRGLRGRRRDALAIECERFPEHKLLLVWTDWGASLAITFYLAVEPRLTRDLQRAARFHENRRMRFELGAEFDAFDLQDLSSWITGTRRALENAIRVLIGDDMSTVSESSLGSLDSVYDYPSDSDDS